MKTFTQETKDRWIKTMTEHREADRLIRGTWIDPVADDSDLFKGCFFGCAMQTDNNPLEKAAKEMSLPMWLVYLAEKIYENLPDDEYLNWPVDLLNAIPVKADIEKVRHELAIWRLSALAEKNNDVAPAIQKVIKCHKNTLSGVTNIDWSAAAESAAESAGSSARSAAWSAARSAAWSAGSSARSAAWSAAESAAWSARSARSAAESAAESAAWSAEAKKLIELLKTI